MKRLFPIFVFSFVSLLFCSFVYADTVDVYITDDMFSKLSNISDMTSVADNSCGTGGVNCNYFIYYQDNYSYTDLFFAINKLNQNNPCGYVSSGTIRSTNDSWKYNFNSSFTSIDSTRSFLNNSDFRIYDYTEPKSIYLLLYSKFDIPWCTSNGIGNTINYHYGSDVLSIVASSDNHVLTIKELNDYFNSSPPDDYPLLTSFYSTVVDKILYFCDYVVNDYVFLFIFTILIFIFILEILRRYLI